MLRVYLAGDFHGGWQDRVIEAAPNNTYFDPRKHGYTVPADYVRADLGAISISDIVFAYLEAGNPCPYNVCIEIGYAIASGSVVFIVDEKRGNDGLPERYHRFMEAATDGFYFTEFEDALEFFRFFMGDHQFPGGPGWRHG